MEVMDIAGIKFSEILKEDISKQILTNLVRLRIFRASNG